MCASNTALTVREGGFLDSESFQDSQLSQSSELQDYERLCLIHEDTHELLLDSMYVTHTCHIQK